MTGSENCGTGSVAGTTGSCGSGSGDGRTESATSAGNISGKTSGRSTFPKMFHFDDIVIVPSFEGLKKKRFKFCLIGNKNRCAKVRGRKANFILLSH